MFRLRHLFLKALESWAQASEPGRVNFVPKNINLCSAAGPGMQRPLPHIFPSLKRY